MKKHLIMALMAAFAAFTFCSCGDDEVEPKENEKNEVSIVGEWSGIMDGDEVKNDFVRVHFNFKANGTYEQTMPAWGEKDFGKYSVKGNVVTFELTSIRAIGDESINGDLSFYDKYGCYYNYETDTYFENPFAEYAKRWPGRIHYSAKYSFDKKGNLHFETLSGEGPGFGLDLVYYKNPGFKPSFRAE